ncbi:hypothetical protein [Conyzicola sp.]|uniref:hypothetical protein n=1 Tax=Conyzicola sp. TaxID=1969404 RepID=UPI0039892D81
MLTRETTKTAAPFLLVGAGAALLALLPWLATGMRLPLQNLWAASTMPDDMPLVLLPFSQYALGFIVSVIITGSAIAGGIVRLLGSRVPRFGLAAALVGTLLVQVIALVQTAATVIGGLSRGGAATVYLVALVGGTLAAILLGVLVLLLIARAPAPGVAIALSIVAVAVGASMSGAVLPFGLVVFEAHDLARAAVQWIPAIGVGVAIAWSGFATVGRAVAAAGSLLLLWLGAAAFTAINAAAGTRVLAAYPAEMVEYAGQVFAAVLGSPRESVVQVAIAVVAMLVALVVFRVIRSRRSAEAPADAAGA